MVSAPSSDRFFADHSLRSHCLPNCASLSFGFVVDKLAKHCHAFGHLFDCGQRIFGVNAVELSPTNGFTSRVLRCEFEFGALSEEKRKMAPKEEKRQVISAIAKVISLERMGNLIENFVGKEQAEKMRNIKEQSETITFMLLQFHRNECNFYELAASSPPLPLPKVFYTQSADDGDGVGLILMQDLCGSAHLEPFEEGLTVRKTETVVRHLAHFHAKMSARNDWQKSFLDTNEMFEGQQQNEKGSISQWFDGMHGQMVDFSREKLEVPLKRMRRIFISMDFAKWAQRKCHELGVEETLIHNDLWINNILWHNGQSEEVAAFIDWQLASRGNPMIDMARLLLMNTSPEVRKELERDDHIFKQYLDIVQTEGRHGQLELEQLTKAYKLAMVGQAVGCVMTLPFFQRVWANEANCERKNAKLLERAVAALEDAIKVLEEEAPEWLEDATEETKG